MSYRQLRCFGVFLVATLAWSASLLAQGSPINGTAEVSLFPDTGTVAAGEPFEMALLVDLSQVTGRSPSGAAVPAVLGSYSITITFDRTLLSFELASGGDTPQFGGAPVATPRATANAQGSVTLTATNNSSSSAPTGLVSVASIVFVPLSVGTATLTPVNVSLNTANQGASAGPVPIPSFTQPSNILISDGGSVPPLITGISPSTAAAGGGGFQLTVEGANFTPGTVVRWNGSPRPTTVDSSSLLIATITTEDIATAGTIPVDVIRTDGAASNKVNFTVTGTAPPPGPTITSLTPSTAVAGGASFTLSVTGTNFDSGSRILWNGSPRLTTFVSPTNLTALIPSSDIRFAGTAAVTVANSAGVVSPAATFTITPPEENPVPVITSLSPETAVAGGFGFTLTVTGENFVPGAIVRWNDVGRATTFVSSTQLTALIPDVDIAAPGTVNVTVTNPAPGGGPSNRATFVISAPEPIVLSSLSPTSVAAGSPSAQITVTGSGFTPQSQVLWNGSPRTTSFLSSTQLVVSIPASDLATARSVSITVASSGGVSSNALPFVVASPGSVPPAIISITPASAVTGGPAFTLSVIGTNFTSSSVLQWNGSARPTTFISPSRLDAAITAADLANGGFASISVLNPGGDNLTSNTVLFAVTGPGGLLADFTWSPSIPAAGQPVTFTDRSLGPIASRLWNFGDGGTSTETNPTHVFAASGTYTVTLTVTGGGASSSRTATVFVGASAALTSHLIIPAVSHVTGAGGTLFRSELMILNAGTQAAQITLTYIPHAGPVRTRTITIEGGRSQTWDSVVSELFNDTSSSGALLIDATGSSRPEIYAASRLFASSGAGTFGQFVGAQRTLPQVSYLTGLQSNPDYRTNIGLVNQSDSFVNAVLTLTNADGTVIGNASVGMLPRTSQQSGLTAIFPLLEGQSLRDLSLRVQTGNANALAVYASVLDNRTQDPIFIPGTGLPGPSQIVPVVARTPGLGGTVWRSDLSIHNPTNETMILELRLLGARRNVTLFPGDTTLIEDVMTFMGLGNGSGALEIVKPSGGTGPIVSSRTYTPRAGGSGTFGQFVPSRDLSAFTSDAVITGLRSDAAFRTNVGFVNGGTTPIAITVTMIDAGGVERARANVTVGPKGQVQMPLNALFNVSVAGRFSLRAHTDSGPNMLMYASVIDNSSGDPIFNDGR